MKKRQGNILAFLLVVLLSLPCLVSGEGLTIDPSKFPSAIGLPSQPEDPGAKARDEQEKARLKKEMVDAKAQAQAKEKEKKDMAAELKALKEDVSRLKKEKDAAERMARKPAAQPVKEITASVSPALDGPSKSEKSVAPNPMATYTDSLTGMEFVYVKGGCYQMGDTFEKSPGLKRHEVCVEDLWMGKYEVTQGEWEKVVGKNKNRSAFKKGPRYPVENVNWKDANVFIEELNRQNGSRYRLPTEAEWEFAARSGGKKEKWAGTSDASHLGEYIWYWDNSAGSTAYYATHEVGTRKPNGLGLYDMTGNVSEWCADWYGSDYYNSSPRNNPHGPPSGLSRVIRGGTWQDSAWNAQAAYRGYNAPHFRYDQLGFRLALPPGK